MNITLKISVVSEARGATKQEAFERATKKIGLKPILVEDELKRQMYYTAVPEGGMYVYHAEKRRNAHWVDSGSGWTVTLYQLPHNHIATVRQEARHFTFTTL